MYFNPITRSIIRLNARQMQTGRTTVNMLRQPRYPLYNSYRMYGNSNASKTIQRSHRQFSDCAFGEPAYQSLFAEPVDNMYSDSLFPESPEKVLSSHHMVDDIRLVYMGYSLVTKQDTTERQHSVAFITLHQPLSSREKEALIHELLYLCGNLANGPSKIFIVDSVPSLEDQHVDRLMMSE